MFGADCRHTLVLKIVGAGYAYAARAVHVDAVAVNIDGLARNSDVFEFEVGGDRGERSGIFLRGAEIVEMSQLHQVCVEHQAWDLTVGDLQVPGSSHSREWTGGVLDGPLKLEISVQISVSKPRKSWKAAKRRAVLIPRTRETAVKVGVLFARLMEKSPVAFPP